jgi:hypothetical protein
MVGRCTRKGPIAVALGGFCFGVIGAVSADAQITAGKDESQKLTLRVLLLDEPESDSGADRAPVHNLPSSRGCASGVLSSGPRFRAE